LQRRLKAARLSVDLGYINLSGRAGWQLKTPVEIIAELREWFRAEAEKLPAGAHMSVLRALEDSNSALACIELYRLQDAGDIPASWSDKLDELWGFAR
jgi:hypothetical protein